jgi:trehalose-6-phosphatase
MGNDRTDEEMFAALPDDAVTVHVGSSPSRAHVRVADFGAVRAILSALVDESSLPREAIPPTKEGRFRSAPARATGSLD